ncbi:helix-turn-helix domain-containing protein [Frondihabitans cladoniiphilus]|uniref:Helix-turn-helix domain-containing protein n=1 Tax=Frondihabitans cladoniiphilus TaxID=715785 RepID=A0ABP8W9M0_9MICO
MSARARQIGDFLRARRAGLSPTDVSLPESGSPRRVPGLRREEVAHLAAISVDYLTRLEQGRVAASTAVIATLGVALRLGHDDRTYLSRLLRPTTGAATRSAPSEIRPALRRLLDQLSETPALLLGNRMDILAWNECATALYLDFEALPLEQRNYVWLLFTHPAMRALHLEWEHDARSCVAALRMESSRSPEDPQLEALVDRLSTHSRDFARWWAEHRVSSATYGSKQYRHPLVGRLALDCDLWGGSEDDGQRLMVLTAESGTPSADALRLLTSWDRTVPAP